MPDKPLLLYAEADEDVPLYYAVQWVATHSGTKDADTDGDDAPLWEWACNKVLAAILSGHIEVLGVKRRNVLSAGDRGGAPPEKVEAYRFRDCAVQSPYHFNDFDYAFDLFGRDWLLRIYPCSDRSNVSEADNPYELEPDPPGAEWYDGLSDSLMNRAMSGWAQLTVKAGAVLRRWPVGDSAASAPRKQGRPSAMDHYVAEHQRRFVNGEALPRIGVESEALEQWGRLMFGPKNRYKAKPIERAIRTRYPERYSQK